MRKNLILTGVLILVFSFGSYAQENAVKELAEAAEMQVNIDDTSSNKWRLGGVFNLNLNQSSLTNWSAGGDKSALAVTGLFNGYASYRKGKSTWDNIADFTLGFTKTTTTGSRKSDDHLYLTSQYGYQLGNSGKWFYSGLLDFKTQFARGYIYNKDNTQTFNSAFLSPAYVLVSAGINYKPNDNFNIFLSPLTERWTIVRSDVLSNEGKYGVTPGKHSYNELGAFLTARYQKDLTADISWTSRVDVFSNYKHNPQNVDIYFNNLIGMKINRYLAATITLNFIYDDDMRVPSKEDPDREVAKLQIQEALGIGFSYKF